MLPGLFGENGLRIGWLDGLAGVALAPLDDISDRRQVRKNRLRELIEQRFNGQVRHLADEAKESEQTIQTLLKGPFFGERKARALESALSLPNKWLEPSPSPEHKDLLCQQNDAPPVDAQALPKQSAHTVELSQLSQSRLQNLKLISGATTDEEVIRRALTLYERAITLQRQGGLLIEQDGRGKMREIVLV